MELMHHHFQSLSSTNDWGKEHLQSFDPTALTVITADGQTHGRGQYGRSWIAPKHKNLYVTYCFVIPSALDDIPSITHLMAVTLCDLLQEEGVTPNIKWPNDVLVGKRKIAGILCETSRLGDDVGVILGVGLNINMEPDDFKSIGQPATSLCIETGSHLSPSQFLKPLTALFKEKLELYLKEGFIPFQPSFQKFLYVSA